MEEKKEGFSRLSDIYGFRILTRSVGDCYVALGAVHRRWAAVPGRFKDYISQPKSNGYRSIHTTVSGRDGKRVEVQIRTAEMHAVAETGVAAHWSYKDGERFENPFAVDPFKWLHAITERLRVADDSEDFLEHVKLEMFQDQVFCFTPKGDVVKLPRGATPIDFAYAIHTRIGDSCVGAKVDGQRVPLWTKLRNGQSVTIIRAEGQRPQPSWEDMVVTGRAKAAIRRSLRGEQRATQVRLGREIARVALERVGKKATDKAIEAAARRLGLEEADDVLARLGAAEMTGKELVDDALSRAACATPRCRGRRTAPRPVIIGLGSGQEAQPAPCCNPIPGERIVGIAVRGKGVMVHAIDCAELGRLRGHARPLDRPALGRGADQRRPRRPHRGGAGQRRRRARAHLHADRRAARQHHRHRLHRPQARLLPHGHRYRGARHGAPHPRPDRHRRRFGRGAGPAVPAGRATAGGGAALRPNGRRPPGARRGGSGRMVFKRRDKPALLARLRESLLPRRGWRRGDRVPRPPGAPAARHARTASRSASPAASSSASRRSSGCISSWRAGARAGWSRGNVVASLDRHRRRQSADLSADRLDLARRSAGASSATARPGATPSRVSDAFGAVLQPGSGAACSASSAAARPSGAG